MNSKALKLAHAIKTNFSSWSEALKFAWKKVKVKKALRSLTVKFSFLKKNGEVREATGTTKGEYSFKGTSKPSPFHIVKYFDLDKNAWRCFDLRRLISIIS
jgi:hypothetical protein